MSRRHCCMSIELVKNFPVKGGVLARVIDQVHAVDDVSFESQPARRWAWSANPAAASPRPAAASCG